MSKKKSVLGRGLNVLIPVEEEKQNQVYEISVNQIRPNPFQPRKEFEEDEIRELADSIKENGLLQPVLVRKSGAGYELISGERRLRSFKLLNKKSIPALVADTVSDSDMLKKAIVENIQRSDLNEIEEAQAYHILLEEYGLSHEDLAEKLGKSRSGITNTLRLLKLPEMIQNALKKKKISMGHARALLAVSDTSLMERIYNDIIMNQYSVRSLEERIKQLTGDKPSSKKGGIKTVSKTKPVDPDLEQVRERLEYRLGTKVQILQKKDNGCIEIKYFGNKDLNRLISMLLGENE